MFVASAEWETETPEGMVWAGEVCLVWPEEGEGGLATNCVSCCSCMVRAARVELMLHLETCCLSVSSCRWCCRYPKALATP